MTPWDEDMVLQLLAKQMQGLFPVSNVWANVYTVVMHPECAKRLAARGWSKQDVQNYLYEKAKIPYEKIESMISKEEDLFHVPYTKEELIRQNIAKGNFLPEAVPVVFHLNDWHNQILPNWARAIIISKEAFEKNGIDWVRMNPVGTGPLKFEEFKRDVSLRFSRFEDYWQEDMPYLDGFEVVFVPDPEVAQAMLEAGEVHMWNGVPIKNQVELVEKGFVRQSGWAGMQYHLIPNTVDPNSPFADKRVREALEYAIDKEALAEVLGYGFFEPMYTVAVKGEWGGDREFRAYNPEKAKELLNEAGYTDGLEVSLLAAGSSGRNEAAEAIANYLNQVGFNVKLDIADFGRFLNASWKDGWEDLIITFTGNNMNQLMSFQRWWGHDPANNIVSFNRPEKLLELSKESLTKQTLEEQKAITEEMVYIIAEEALVVPLYNEPSAFVHNGKVHTTFFQKGLARWDFHDTWIEP